MRGLTDRQKEIASFLAEFTEEKGYAPTCREIAERFGFSPKAAFDHLTALHKKGVIDQKPAISRGIRIMDVNYRSTPRIISIPILGCVAAGTPLFTEENVETTIKISSDLCPKATGELFAMKVRGQSMVEAGINDGDIAILEKRHLVENGEIALVGVGEDKPITLKYFFRGPNAVTLKPANQTFKDLITNNCEVYGKLVMLIRRYDN
ncbi:MAG: transcriptional repressor LexA [Sphaerochaetaceae bacterium]|jgi:repressor LexA|nr:transcriptional repressor LexA [Sphaerochaetaceae bacterium]